MDERTALEADVAARCRSGDHAGAARAIVIGYGPELVRFLASLVRGSDDDLAEVFALCCEDLVRGLPGFRQVSSVRTWVYIVARRAAAQFARGDRRRRRRIALPGELADVAASVHGRTATYLRTAMKDRLTAARARLEPDEQELLVLRVDQQLGWREIAQITADGELDAAALRRREQALRKRFETLKRRLKEHLAAG